MTATTPAALPESSTSVLRRLPPLPGEVIEWPTTRVAPAVQGVLDLDMAAIDRDVVMASPQSAARAMQARAARFALAVAEVLVGDRPVGQLSQWMTHEVFDEVAAMARTTRTRIERPRLLSAHVTRPADEVAEVCGHIRHGERSRAMALRLEQRKGRWVCTALRLG